jgi:DNA-directed RNA polymerase specialized sigma24 family protein
MTHPQITAAALVDAHGDELFRYCWFLLRSRDAAEVAVRDALVVAAAHVDRLPGRGRPRVWLYALARVECRRRRPVPPGAADEPPARPSQPDADSRVLAWNAVTSMDPPASEVLELRTRHDMEAVDVAAVIGMTVPETEALLASAEEELSRSLGAQLVIRRTGFDCAGLTGALRGGRSGAMTPQIRDRVLAHATGCAICGRQLPRGVSAARVFALLPAPGLDAATRDVLLTRLTEDRHAGYRSFVARRAEQSAALAFGSPVPAVSEASHVAPVTPTGRRRGGKLLAGVAAAGVAAAAAAAIVLVGFPTSPGRGPSPGAQASGSASAAPGGSQRPPSRIGAIGAAPVAAHSPGKSSPPLLAVNIPDRRSPGRYGQALYLSASPQSSAPLVPAPPRTAASSAAASPPRTGAPTPIPTPTATDTGAPAPTPPTPPATGHRRHHLGGATGSGGSGGGGRGGGGPPPSRGGQRGGGKPPGGRRGGSTAGAASAGAASPGGATPGGRPGDHRPTSGGGRRGGSGSSSWGGGQQSGGHRRY